MAAIIDQHIYSNMACTKLFNPKMQPLALTYSIKAHQQFHIVFHIIIAMTVIIKEMSHPCKEETNTNTIILTG